MQYLELHHGFYIDFSNQDEAISVKVTTDAEQIYVDTGEGYKSIVIKGIKMDSAIPGEHTTDFAIDKDTYLRWFELIAEMGANTIRVETLFDSDFYDALYAFNKERDAPLYLIQGVGLEEYIQNSSVSAYDVDFRGQLKRNGRTTVDAIHGRAKIPLARGMGSGRYSKDVSEWLLGYIVGSSWNAYTVAYTDYSVPKEDSYEGKYFEVVAEASAFENVLAEVMDEIVAYETDKYKQQHLISFANEAYTDPFEYNENVSIQLDKFARIDAEHIRPKEALQSGYFASYNLEDYYTNFSTGLTDEERVRLKTPLAQMDPSTLYRGYVDFLNIYHTMPVLILEYAYSTGRGTEQVIAIEGKKTYNLTETEQGKLLASTYEDLIGVGCAGAILSEWQDNWERTSWNSVHAVNREKKMYWSDRQSPESFYGLLAFEPGKTERVCYVDGNLEEWTDQDKVYESEERALSAKYDAEYIYLLAYSKGREAEKQTLYIPIDTLQTIGSTSSERANLTFEKGADFLLEIKGHADTRLFVQEAYDTTYMVYSESMTGVDAFIEKPDEKSPVFMPIQLAIQKVFNPEVDIINMTAKERAAYNYLLPYETGLLRYGNSHPNHENYDSLADFIFAGDYVEVRLPWQLLNFSNPAQMKIHDNYYTHYGVEEVGIQSIQMGIGTNKEADAIVEMPSFEVRGWRHRVETHERLKTSYWIMQDLWLGAFKGGVSYP